MKKVLKNVLKFKSLNNLQYKFLKKLDKYWKLKMCGKFNEVFQNSFQWRIRKIRDNGKHLWWITFDIFS